MYIRLMKWSAIITTYNSEKVIGSALESLFALPSGEKPSEVVIVDNASSDDTISILDSYNLQIKKILNRQNLGLSKANNLGAALAGGDSLFFLNPDVELMPGVVTALQKFQEENPKAAIIGPAMLDEKGIRQSTARTWPTPLVIASRRTPLGRTAWGGKISLNHMNRFNSSSAPIKPHWLVGAAMWLTPGGRKKVGLMSEKYFLYFEDVEWCWRAWQRGMEVWYEPRAEIRHVCHRESTSGGVALKLHLKSMLRFMTEHPGVLVGAGPGGEQ
ncbi:MAG: glycosyltransferase family 2 protein [Candidatus Sabulitectum sp.]|nr:glycosyltransferase family 2 protein [Candidatus Sabulitectum sp.]